MDSSDRKTEFALPSAELDGRDESSAGRGSQAAGRDSLNGRERSMSNATKTKKSPHDRLETYVKWSAGATLGILIGIIIEIVVLAYYEYHPGWKFWSSVAANVLIGAGLLIEFFCIRWTIIASREAEDANRAKLAAALDRAVAAEQELLEFRKTNRGRDRPAAGDDLEVVELHLHSRLPVRRRTTGPRQGTGGVAR
jgi:hypothetical protein